MLCCASRPGHEPVSCLTQFAAVSSLMSLQLPTVTAWELRAFTV